METEFRWNTKNVEAKSSSIPCPKSIPLSGTATWCNEKDRLWEYSIDPSIHIVEFNAVSKTATAASYKDTNDHGTRMPGP
ncbi:hypothetical protein VTP01DRAFT_6487 [Rhizomucor pusillus]|uniref:uncharacterized protein n=1 Tax=Rhizomucor pusillus TaxID=4840 RepID=UPI00374288F6